MADETIRVDRKEHSSADLIEFLDDGKKVVITVEALGVERDVVLRKRNEEYICDTGIKLMHYDSRQGMQTCIERLQLATSS